MTSPQAPLCSPELTPLSLLNGSCYHVQTQRVSLLGLETKSLRKEGTSTWLASSPCSTSSSSWARRQALLSWKTRALSWSTFRRSFLSDSSSSWILQHGSKEALTQDAVNMAEVLTDNGDNILFLSSGQFNSLTKSRFVQHSDISF